MDIDKLREQLKIDEGCVYNYITIILVMLLSALAIWLLSQTPKTVSTSEQKYQNLEWLKPSSKMSKQYCQTAPSFIQTSMSCQKKLNK